MWVCPRCRERHEEHFEVCWACGEPRGYRDLPDQVTCDGTRLLSPTEAEELAAREALQKKAWHPHEEHEWQATAAAHRFASLAARRAAWAFLALGFGITLIWDRNHYLNNLIAVPVTAVLSGLLAWPMALFAYLMVVNFGHARPGAGPHGAARSHSAFGTAAQILEGMLAKGRPGDHPLDTHALRWSRDFLDDADSQPQREATEQFLGAADELTAEVERAWGPPEFRGGPGEEGWPDWAEGMLRLACWRREERTAFVAVRQEGHRLALELILGVAHRADNRRPAPTGQEPE
jgi:hypothetical protein